MPTPIEVFIRTARNFSAYGTSYPDRPLPDCSNLELDTRRAPVRDQDTPDKRSKRTPTIERVQIPPVGFTSTRRD